MEEIESQIMDIWMIKMVELCCIILSIISMAKEVLCESLFLRSYLYRSLRRVFFWLSA